MGEDRRDSSIEFLVPARELVAPLVTEKGFPLLLLIPFLPVSQSKMIFGREETEEEKNRIYCHKRRITLKDHIRRE